MALYFYFNETTGDLVYSDKSTYDVSGYTSLGEQTNMSPTSFLNWVFDSKRNSIKTVSKDPVMITPFGGLKRMDSMFSDCFSLTSLDLSGFDTSQVEDMSDMFAECNSLTSLDLSGFDTSQVTSMARMFYECSRLASLDLSGFDTSQVTYMNNMFSTCSALKALDLSGFDTSEVTEMRNMFYFCRSLRLLKISGSISNVLSTLPSSQYYPASGGDPVAKASLTAGTWVRDEADLSLLSTITEQAQMIMSLRRQLTKIVQRITKLETQASNL